MELFLMVEPISVAKPAGTTALSGSPPKAPGFAGGYLILIRLRGGRLEYIDPVPAVRHVVRDRLIGLVQRVACDARGDRFIGPAFFVRTHVGQTIGELPEFPVSVFLHILNVVFAQAQKLLEYAGIGGKRAHSVRMPDPVRARPLFVYFNHKSSVEPTWPMCR